VIGRIWIPSSGPNKTKINDTKEPNDANKNTLKKSENFIEQILDMVNQSVQEELKKLQDTKNKYKKTQEK
jgi:hypothetical protein